MSLGIKWLLIIFIVSLPSCFAVCQCIPRDSLWNRLTFLRNDASIPPSDQLTELKKYLAASENCSYRYDSLGAFLLQRIGAVYFKLSDLSQAEFYTRTAIRLIESKRGMPSINESHLVKYYYALIYIYDAQNNFYKKNRAEDSCISIALRTKTTDQYLLKTIYEHSKSLYESGDFNRCLQYALEGEIINAKLLHGTDSLRYSYSFLLWQINALYFLNQPNQAEVLLLEKIPGYQKNTDISFYAGLLERLAAVKTQKKEYHEAVQYFKKSLDIDSKKKSFVNCAQILINMGYYLYFGQLHKYDSALICFNQALNYLSKTGVENSSEASEIKIQKIAIYGNIANTYSAMNRFDSSELYFRNAYRQVDTSLHEKNLIEYFRKDPSQNFVATYILYTLIDQADALLRKYQVLRDPASLKKAAGLYRLSDQLQQMINSDQLETESRLFWRNNVKRLYEHAVETCYLLGKAEDAFIYFEKSRAALLIDNLNKQNTLGKEEIFKLAQVKQKVLLLNTKLAKTAANSSDYDDVHSKLFAASQDLSELEESFKKRNPLYYNYLVDTAYISVTDVQKKILENHSAFLELFEGDSSVYTVFITKNNCQLVKIDKQDFDKTSAQYKSMLSDEIQLNGRFDQFAKVSNHLYQLIFKRLPVPYGRIIISPDGNYFPFESLLVNSTRQPHYFLVDHTTSYTYSAKYILAEFSENKTDSTINFLGIAPVQYPDVYKLSPLVQSDLSAENISSGINNSRLLTASEATRQNFMRQYFNSKIIQLYTHASDSSGKGEPVIFFSDSVLYLSELIPENKPASRLVVLSACETANGKLYNGEGVFSFNRGFAAMGIPSSVTNLWSVDNQSTYKITELFYKYVAKGLPLDIALQKAKLDFIAGSSKEKGLPYYWAPAILVGKTDSIVISSPVNWTRIFVYFLAVSAVIAGIVFRKNRFAPGKN